MPIPRLPNELMLMILDFMLPLLKRYQLYLKIPNLSPTTTQPIPTRYRITTGTALAEYAVACRTWQYRIEAILFRQLIIKVNDNTEFSVAERVCVSHRAHIRELGFLVTDTKPGRGSSKTGVDSPVMGVAL